MPDKVAFVFITYDGRLHADRDNACMLLLSGSCFPLGGFDALYAELGGPLAGKTAWFEIYESHDAARVACLARLLRGLGGGAPAPFAVKTPMQGVFARRHAAALVERYRCAPPRAYDLRAPGVFTDECLIASLLYHFDIDQFKALFDGGVLRHKSRFEGARPDPARYAGLAYAVSNFHYSFWDDPYLRARLDPRAYRAGDGLPYAFKRVDATLAGALRDVGVHLFRKVEPGAPSEI